MGKDGTVDGKTLVFLFIQPPPVTSLSGHWFDEGRVHYYVGCLFFYLEGISSYGLRSTNNEYTRRPVVGKG